MHARTDTDFVQEFRRALLDYAGTNTSEHVLGAALFQDYVVDAVLAQELPEQKPGWSGTDDGNLRPHSPAP